jgi:membrane protease YdiL (CAAX protease family)
MVEEIFFRGFVFAGLRERYGWQRAALISSALFGVIHFTPTAIMPIFILGCVFAYLYQRSGSIWPAILMHAFSNALALGAAFVLASTNLGQ